MNRCATRRLLRTAPLLLLFLGIGCQSGPTVAEVQEETDRQHRVLQQTISQLRKGLDEVRNQRDDVQTKYLDSSGELETAQKELTFLEAQMRAERDVALNRGGQLETHKDQLTRTKRELSGVKSRATKLERELASLRVAFEAEQQAHSKLQQGVATSDGKIAAADQKFTRAQKQWETERSALRASLQATEDEVAILEERIADAEGVVASGTRSTPDSSPSNRTAVVTPKDSLPRGRADYYDTPPPLAKPHQTGSSSGAVVEKVPVNPAVSTPITEKHAGAVVAPRIVAGNAGDPPNATNANASSAADATDTTKAADGVKTPNTSSGAVVVPNPNGSSTAKEVGAKSPVSSPSVSKPEGFVDQVKQSISFAVVQFRSFIKNPGKNYSELLHPVPIAMILIVLGVPLLLLRMGRRRRRNAKQARETVRVSVASTRTQRSAQHSRGAARRGPTTRVDENSTVTGTFIPTNEPMSPANVGSIAATLDAVLGGDPVSEPDKTEKNSKAKVISSGGGDEDDLLGDLKDIVSKGLS